MEIQALQTVTSEQAKEIKTLETKLKNQSQQHMFDIKAVTRHHSVDIQTLTSRHARDTQALENKLKKGKEETEAKINKLKVLQFIMRKILIYFMKSFPEKNVDIISFTSI